MAGSDWLVLIGSIAVGVLMGIGFARLQEHWPGPFRTRKRPFKVGDRVRYVGRVDQWSPDPRKLGTVVKRRPGWHEVTADVLWDEQTPSRTWPASLGEIERVL